MLARRVNVCHTNENFPFRMRDGPLGCFCSQRCQNNPRCQSVNFYGHRHGLLYMDANETTHNLGFTCEIFNWSPEYMVANKLIEKALYVRECSPLFLSITNTWYSSCFICTL